MFLYIHIALYTIHTMPRTHCTGFHMKFTRHLDRKDYIEMIESIQKRLNDDYDPVERRYRVVPEAKWEGGILLTEFPGSKGEGYFKSIRHMFREKSITGYRPDPYPWPWIYDTVFEDWKSSEKRLVSSGMFASTFLRASPRNTVWTLDELHSIASVMCKDYGIECTLFPKDVHLTMNYGPIYL